MADLEEFIEVESALARENRSLRRALNVSSADNAELKKLLDIISSIDQHRVKPPRWMAPPKMKAHRAIANLLITDTHFDEVVRPEELFGSNAYNRQIAELRLKAAFQNAIQVARDYLAGITYDGCVLMLGGDLISGDIHDELTETNEDTSLGTVFHFIDPLEAGISLLAEFFGKVHVAGVVGNHPRRTRKPRSKLRARDNLDWAMYKLIERDFKDDERVTVQVTEAPDALISVYDTRYLLTHGDQFRGGSGISGALAPLMLGSHRKTRKMTAMDEPYDIMVMGHWHQYISIPAKGILVGGTLKGYDEYASTINAEPEPPQQAFWLTTPEHGATFAAPIYVMDRKAEGW